MKVLLTKPLLPVGMEILKQNNINFTIAPSELNKTELIDFCKDYDALINVGHVIDFNKDFFSTCPSIKMIALFSVGFDQVNVNDAKEFGIKISNTPDVLSKATSDIAFLLMLAASRKAFSQYDRIKQNDWEHLIPERDFGIELYNKKLGIFGLGRIGIEMAKKCKAAFDMEIIYHNRQPKPELEKEVDAKYVSFEELIQDSDVLSIHSSLNDSTKGLFNKDVLNKMKSNAILVNTARGPIINQEDLYHSLKENKIFAAGLDVTDPEPMQADDKLLSLSNVCILPHIGSATFETRNKMAELCAKNIVEYIQKGEIITPIF